MERWVGTRDQGPGTATLTWNGRLHQGALLPFSQIPHPWSPIPGPWSLVPCSFFSSTMSLLRRILDDAVDSLSAEPGRHHRGPVSNSNPNSSSHYLAAFLEDLRYRVTVRWDQAWREVPRAPSCAGLAAYGKAVDMVNSQEPRCRPAMVERASASARAVWLQEASARRGRAEGPRRALSSSQAQCVGKVLAALGGQPSTAWSRSEILGVCWRGRGRPTAWEHGGQRPADGFWGRTVRVSAEVLTIMNTSRSRINMKDGLARWTSAGDGHLPGVTESLSRMGAGARGADWKLLFREGRGARSGAAEGTIVLSDPAFDDHPQIGSRSIPGLIEVINLSEADWSRSGGRQKERTADMDQKPP